MSNMKKAGSELLYDGRVRGRFDQVEDPLMQERMDRMRCDLSKRNEDKVPLGQTGVRDLQPAGLDHCVPGQQDVDVDRPGPLIDGRDALHLLLNDLDQIQESRWIKLRVDLDDLVIEPGLAGDIDRLGPIDGGGAQDPHAVFFKQGTGQGQVFFPITQVGAQRQEVSHLLSRSKGIYINTIFMVFKAVIYP